MKFAKVVNGVVEEFREYPAAPPCKHIGGLPMLRPVSVLAKPPHDPITERLVEVTTVYPDRVDLGWAVEPLPPAQIAANQRIQADDQARTDVKADAFVQQFVAMTPAQVRSYVDANVTDLASARTLLKQLAIMTLLLAKREYRD